MAKNFGVAKKIQNGLTRYHYVHISSVPKNHKVSCTEPEANGIVAMSDDVYVPLTDIARRDEYKARSYYNYGFWYINPKKTDSFLPGQKPDSTRGSNLPIATHERLMGGDIYFVPMKVGTKELDFENKVSMRNIDELAIIAGARSFPRQHVTSGTRNGGVRNTTKVKIVSPSKEELLKLETRLETLVGLAVAGTVTPAVEIQIDDTINQLRKLGDGKFVDELFTRLHSSIMDDEVVENTTSSLIPLEEASQEITLKNEREAEMAAIRAAIEKQAEEVQPVKTKKAKKELVTV